MFREGLFATGLAPFRVALVEFSNGHNVVIAGYAFLLYELPDKIAHIQTVHVTQFCKGIVRDADNAVVAAKLFGDFLKAQGIIEDDGPKFIETIVLTTKKGKENRTVILIS